jgi:hypothetical protein
MRLNFAKPDANRQEAANAPLMPKRFGEVKDDPEFLQSIGG